MPAPDLLRPRKPPRQARSAATVDAILEGAARILEERGLEGFNTNAVADRAGVSVGSLYRYFPGKDALAAALIRRGHAALLARVRAAVAPGPDGGAPPGLDDGLRALVAAAVAHHAERPRLARLLDVEERRLPLDAEGAATAAAVGGRIAGFLAAHRGRLAVQDVAEAAHDAAAIARGMVNAESEREAPDPAALERRVLRAVRGYLLGAADPPPS